MFFSSWQNVSNKTSAIVQGKYLVAMCFEFDITYGSRFVKMGQLISVGTEKFQVSVASKK